jgi:Bacterial pre-peptidase C-terminal domain
MKVRELAASILLLILVVCLAGCFNDLLGIPTEGEIDQEKPKSVSMEEAAPSDVNLPRSAVEVYLNMSLGGSLDSTGDSILYRIDNVPANTFVEISLDGPSGADFDLYIRAGSEPTLSAYDDRGYTGTSDENVRITSGAYPMDVFVLVRSYRGTGGFALDISGNTGESSDNSINRNSTTSGNLSSSGDRDTFMIPALPSGTTLTATLDGPASADFDLYIRVGAEPTTSTYDDLGYSGSSHEEVEASVTSGTQPIYVMIHSYDGSGAYTLVVESNVAGDDDDPPVGDQHGDSSNTATLLVPGSTIQGQIDPSSDIDFFRIEVAARCAHRLTVSRGSIGRVKIALHTRGGLLGLYEIAERTSGGSTAELSWTVESADTVYATVEGVSGGSGTYEIQLERWSCPVPDTSIGIAYIADVTAISNWVGALGGSLYISVSDILGNVIHQEVAGTSPSQLSVLLPGPGIFKAYAAASNEEACFGMTHDSAVFEVNHTNNRASITLDVTGPCLPPPATFW